MYILALLLLLRRLCTFWFSIILKYYFLASTASSFSAVILVCASGFGVVRWLDIELSVSAWYHKTRRVLLHARHLLLLLTAESKEQRRAVCGITFKPASNGAET